MSKAASPSSILAITSEAFSAEAERLRTQSKLGGLDDGEFSRLSKIHEMQAGLEQQRSEALLILLGARTNVKDMTPEMLRTLSDAIMSGGGGE